MNKIIVVATIAVLATVGGVAFTAFPTAQVPQGDKSLQEAGANAAEAKAITIWRDPNCGCCAGWVEHIQAYGFKTKVIETAAIDAVKARLGVPDSLAACHTAEIGGYVIEGHVPAAAIDRLLAERPRAKGLAVPGMPAGSPGMGGAPETYDVVLFGPSGQSVFGKFKGETQI